MVISYLVVLEKALLWTEHLYVSWKQWFVVQNALMMDMFHANTQFFASQDVNWWTGVCVDYLWIIVMFLSAVWTLILTAPIHCRGSTSQGCNATFLQICCHEETNSSTSWITWRWVNFSKFSFGWTIPGCKCKNATTVLLVNN